MTEAVTNLYTVLKDFIIYHQEIMTLRHFLQEKSFFIVTLNAF